MTSASQLAALTTCSDAADTTPPYFLSTSESGQPYVRRIAARELVEGPA